MEKTNFTLHRWAVSFVKCSLLLSYLLCWNFSYGQCPVPPAAQFVCNAVPVEANLLTPNGDGMQFYQLWTGVTDTGDGNSFHQSFDDATIFDQTDAFGLPLHASPPEETGLSDMGALGSVNGIAVNNQPGSDPTSNMDDQVQLDAFLFVPPSVTCLGFRQGDNSADQAVAFYVGTDLNNMTLMLEEVDNGSGGAGPPDNPNGDTGFYTIPDDVARTNDACGWKVLRVRVYVHDEDVAFNAIVKWDLSGAFAAIGAAYIQSATSADDNTPPTTVATTVANTVEGLLTEDATLWEIPANCNNAPTNVINTDLFCVELEPSVANADCMPCQVEIAEFGCQCDNPQNIFGGAGTNPRDVTSFFQTVIIDSPTETNFSIANAVGITTVSGPTYNADADNTEFTFLVTPGVAYSFDVVGNTTGIVVQHQGECSAVLDDCNCPEKPEVCGDNLDNDFDGAVDAADADITGDCMLADDCETTPVEIQGRMLMTDGRVTVSAWSRATTPPSTPTRIVPGNSSPFNVNPNAPFPPAPFTVPETIGASNLFEHVNGPAGVVNNTTVNTLGINENLADGFGFSFVRADQAQIDAWIVLPPDITCFDLKVNNPGAHDGSGVFLGQSINSMNFIGASYGAASYTHDTATDGSAIQGSAVFQYDASAHPTIGACGWRVVRARVYTHDLLVFNNTIVQWNIGDGFENIPAKYLQSVGGTQADTDTDNLMPTAANEVLAAPFCAFQEADGDLFLANGDFYALNPRRCEMVVNSGCLNCPDMLSECVDCDLAADGDGVTQVGNPVCNLEYFTVTPMVPDNSTGGLLTTFWDRNEGNGFNGRGPNESIFRAFTDYTENPATCPGCLPQHPNAANYTDPTRQYISNTLGVADAAIPDNDGDAFDVADPSVRGGENAQQDGWLLIPGNLDCFDVRLGQTAAHDASALYFGSDIDNMTFVGENVNRRGENPRDVFTYEVPDNLMELDCNCGFEVKLLRVRFYHHDNNVRSNTIVEWNIGEGFVNVPRGRLRPVADQCDNTLPACFNLIAGAPFDAVRDANGDFYDANDPDWGTAASPDCSMGYGAEIDRVFVGGCDMLTPVCPAPAPIAGICTPSVTVTKEQIGFDGNADCGVLGNNFVTMQLEICNTGNVDLDNIELTDMIATEFGAAFVGITSAPAIVASDATTDPTLVNGFDGGAQAVIFDGTTGLLECGTGNMGQCVTVEFEAEIDPDAAGAPSPLTNTANVEADIITTEFPMSEEALNCNNPNTSTDTETIFVSDIRGVKTITRAAKADDGQGNNAFLITFEITLQNVGNTILNNLGVIENLGAADQFGAAFLGVDSAPVILNSTATTDPTINVGFTGTGNLFNGTSGALEPGQLITLEVTVEVDPSIAGAPAAPVNQATVQGDGENAMGIIETFTDLTDSGIEPLGCNDDAPGAIAGSTDDATPLGDCWQAASGTMACNDQVTVSFDEDCVATLMPDMFLEGVPDECLMNDAPSSVDYFCIDAEGLDSDPNTPGIQIDASQVGECLTVNIASVVDENSCWSQVCFEDKLAPVLDCNDVTVECTVDLATVAPAAGTDNCGGAATVTLVDEVLNDDDVCDDNQVILVRTYIAEDELGNQSETCQQIITITRPTDIDFPDDLVWSCEQYAAHPNIIDSTALNPQIAAGLGTTYPMHAAGDAWDLQSIPLTSPLLPNTGSGMPNVAVGTYCMYAFSSNDQILSTCGFDATTDAPVFKIIRTWTILDWCTGNVITGNTAGEDNVQIIKVIDEVGPIVSGANVEISAAIGGAHPTECMGVGPIPSATATDNCTGVVDITASVYSDIALTSVVASVVNNELEPALPLGNYFLVYSAEDACGNITQSTTYTLNIVDDIVPTAICDELTNVSLSSDGLAVVDAEEFDDGSYDNCQLESILVRRMTDACGVAGNTVFGPSVTFCCADVAAGNVMVEMQVIDAGGNSNSCMIEVEVEDKLPATVSCPANASLTCDEYADDLETILLACINPDADAEDNCQSDALTAEGYGAPVVFDNCEPILDVEVTVTTDQCGAGVIMRTFTVTDAGGNGSSSCTQLINIAHVSDWVVEFPEDKNGFCDEADPEFGEPEIFFETCELIATSFEDQFFDIVPDACFKIVRQWTVINWCVVGNVIDQEADAVELSEQQLNQDLDGDGDRDSRTFRDSYRGVLPTSDNDPDADTQDGFITYQQVIKVNDDEAPVIDPAFTVGNYCIIDGNDGTDDDFSDCVFSGILPTPDYTDCTLDVNGNIDNNGQIVNNELTITATVFDANGDVVSNSVVVNNLEIGTYTVRYVAIDRCGNTVATDYDFEVNDCKFPTPYCKDGVVLELMHINDPNNTTFQPMVELWAADLDLGSYDNCPGGVKLSFSANVNDIGTTYNCMNLGENVVQLWVTDAAGNQDFCETFVIIQANQGQCEDDPLVAGNVATETNDDVQDVTVNINGQFGFNSSTTTGADGNFYFEVPTGNDYTLTPIKDINPLNGVSTFDLVKISQHILNVETLDSPYKMIAADANNSQSITTLDLVQLRKLILLIDTEFANNTSWRFVEKAYNFPNANNPWAETFPEVISFNNLNTGALNNDFVAIKIGDVNGSAAVNQLLGADDRTNGALKLMTNNIAMKAGETYTVDFTAADFNHFGYQFTLNFDQNMVAFEGIETGLATADNFGLTLLDEGIITTSWNESAARQIAANDNMFSITFTAKANAQLTDVLQLDARYTTAEAYAANGDLQAVELTFDNQLATNEFELYQNFPNPFAKATTIGFNLPTAGAATLTITDISGKVLRVIEGDFAKGYNEINLTDLSATGLVQYQLTTGEYSATRKMIIVK